jgi:hypothetical protein
MAFQGQLTPHARAGLLYVPELGADYGTVYRGFEMAWAFVVLLDDGMVQTQPLGGPNDSVRTSGTWQFHDNDTVSRDADPRLRTEMLLRDISLGGDCSHHHDFDLEPVFCLVQGPIVYGGQLVWRGGIHGCGIMMDYSRGAMWIPLGHL